MSRSPHLVNQSLCQMGDLNFYLEQRETLHVRRVEFEWIIYHQSLSPHPHLSTPLSSPHNMPKPGAVDLCVREQKRGIHSGGICPRRPPPVPFTRLRNRLKTPRRPVSTSAYRLPEYGPKDRRRRAALLRQKETQNAHGPPRAE